MNEVGVVVSRYYENLKWIEELTSKIDVYVYDRVGESPGMGVSHAVSWSQPKDPKDNLGGLDIQKCKDNGINLQIIQIEDDPGFEAGTYAWHCYSKYDDLNDYTVFLQGHPQVYYKNVIQVLNDPNSIKHTSYKKSTGDEISWCSKTYGSETIDFEAFSDQIGTVNPNTNYHWSVYKQDYSRIPWLEFCKNMPGSKINEEGKWRPADSWEFSVGNQFVASKNYIHRKEKEYYKRLHAFIGSYMDPNGDARPHYEQLNQGPNVMEGTWRFIFL